MTRGAFFSPMWATDCCLRRCSGRCWRAAVRFAPSCATRLCVAQPFCCVSWRGGGVRVRRLPIFPTALCTPSPVSRPTASGGGRLSTTVASARSTLYRWISARKSASARRFAVSLPTKCCSRGSIIPPSGRTWRWCASRVPHCASGWASWATMPRWRSSMPAANTVCSASWRPSAILPRRWRAPFKTPTRKWG